MKCFVTGGAGFIGSHLVDRLLADGHEVVVYDNLSTGSGKFLLPAGPHPKFSFVLGDIHSVRELEKAMAGSDIVFHFAANADVRYGTEYSRRDLDQNTVGTYLVLEAMRANYMDRIVFASSGAVYGEPTVFPTPEDAPFPVQTSLYGASKLAAEALIQAYCAGFGFRAIIYRFVSVLGERYTHGHIIDFYRALCENPKVLRVLGNGVQQKSYLYVEDCIEGVMLGVARQDDRYGVQVYNLGTDETTLLYQSIQWIMDEMGVTPRLVYGGGDRGWPGDSPFILLNCTKMHNVGWHPTVPVKEAVLRTVRYLRGDGVS